MPKDDRVYLGHMLEIARKATGHVKGKRRLEYDDDETLQFVLKYFPRVGFRRGSLRPTGAAFNKTHDAEHSQERLYTEMPPNRSKPPDSAFVIAIETPRVEFNQLHFNARQDLRALRLPADSLPQAILLLSLRRLKHVALGTSGRLHEKVSTALAHSDKA